ncbi:MAG: MBL fold metallo-hydrolase, partial [Clostridiales Family XIII bacterium]|nr:MBL fold metallo-hydrolase [Clostridiales Family XIII bacterium]
VDTGVTGGNLRDEIQRLTGLPVVLVNTHADDDHTAANAQLGAAHMHPAELPYYEAKNGRDAKTAPLWDGDVIDIGGRSFEVILIPGHTPGSIALLDAENRVLVAGDSVTLSPVFLFDPEGYAAIRSVNAFIRSMDRLGARAGEFDTVYPSHGPFPVPPAQIGHLRAAAEKLAAGELDGGEPPFPMLAKLYEHEGAAFFY